MTNTPDVTFYNFQPDRIAGLILQKNWEGCWNYIIELMESFSVQKNLKFNIKVQNMISDEQINQYLKNFSGLMGELLFSLLTDPSVRMPDSSFYKLISMHEVIHNFLRAHGTDNTDQLILELLNKNKNLLPLQQKKLLLLLSVNTDMDMLPILRKMDSEYRAAALSAYLCYIKIYKKNIYENKIKLFQIVPQLKKLMLKLGDAKLMNSILTTVTSCYFSCSYLDYEHKHDVKKYINEGCQKHFQKFLKQNKQTASSKMPDEIGDKLDPNKPKLLIALELYNKSHAMKRSWHTWIQSLQSEFNVVLCITHSLYDDFIKEEYISFSYNSLPDFIQKIQSFAPDIIIYPSVGMSFWGIYASNLRLAPIQMMNLGHPATTMSQHIDFVYGQSCLYDPAAFPSDIYIVDDSPYKFSPVMTKEQILQLPIVSYQKNDTRPLRVSIVGSECKISYPFLALLKELEDKSQFDIEFVFHLSSAGLDAHAMEEYIRQKFKNTTLHGYQSYIGFLTSLSKTDIVLNPYPFGHTNTIIDTLLMGKPCISFLGSEPSSRTEKYILELSGLEDQFQVDNTESYKEKFFELAHKIMDGKTDFFDRAAVYDLFFSKTDEAPIDYGKNIKWIYDHAEEMKNSSEKCFKIPEDKSQGITSDNP